MDPPEVTVTPPQLQTRRTRRSRRCSLVKGALHFTVFYAILSLLKLYSYLRNSVPNDSNINNKNDLSTTSGGEAIEIYIVGSSVSMGGGESDDDDNGKMQSTHWCVLTPNMITRNSQINFQGNNMGHMGESLLPCWSLLFELGAMQQQQHGVRGKAAHTNNDSSFGCGIDTSALGPLRGWSKALVVEAMKCKIYDGRTANETKPNDQLHHPNLYLMSPYYRHMQYISHPSHAHLLRQNLVSDAYISNHKSYDGSERPLQIGLLERKKSRVILNLHDIAAGLSNAMPDTNLTITNFDHGPMIREQAEWWSTKDVIIAAHGSGVMNSVFITPKTIVLQIYPPGWYWPTIEPLITQVGGIALDWYDPEYNPQSLKLSKQSKADKIKANQMNFTVPVKDIVERVMIATGRTDANFQQLVNLLGVPAMYNGAF